jgi:hypothetical protein
MHPSTNIHLPPRRAARACARACARESLPTLPTFTPGQRSHRRAAYPPLSERMLAPTQPIERGVCNFLADENVMLVTANIREDWAQPIL